jgi:hypothetical protein
MFFGGNDMNGYNYDFPTGKFMFDDKHGVIFDFTIRKPRTIVNDKSGVGKTYLCQLINSANLVLYSLNINDYPAIAINYDIDVQRIESFMNLKEKLIIVDNADLLLRQYPFLLKEIVSNTQNDFLIYSRGYFDFEVYPHNAAYFERDHKTVHLKYYITPRRLVV